jgi:replication-associated recombination protein RarA
MPEELNGRIYYQPKESGVEIEIKERLERWRKDREERDS